MIAFHVYISIHIDTVTYKLIDNICIYAMTHIETYMHKHPMKLRYNTHTLWPLYIYRNLSIL